MRENKQFQFETNKVILKVIKSPGPIRMVIFTLACFAGLAPIIGALGNVVLGGKPHFGNIVGIFFFGFIGFYLLRIALWNSYGKEIIEFGKDKLSYVADYKWFQGSKREVEIKEIFSVDIQPVGYEGNQKGRLIIRLEESPIICVTTMPISELEELQTHFKQIFTFLNEKQPEPEGISIRENQEK